MKKRDDFRRTLKTPEKACWTAFCKLCEGFFGNNRDPNYRQLVENLKNAYKDDNILMSLKTHILFEHLDCFPVSCGGFSEEQGERFHQETMLFERRYKNNIKSMLIDYAWSKVMEGKIKFARKPKKHFLPKRIKFSFDFLNF